MKILKSFAKKVPQLKRLVNERNEYASQNNALRDLNLNLEAEKRTAEEKYNILLGKFNYESIFDNKKNVYKNLKDYGFIKKIDENLLVALVPIELLFTEKKDSIQAKNNNITKEWLNNCEKWEDLNLVRIRPLRNLFDFFKGNCTYPNDYFDWYQSLYTTRNLEIPLKPMELIDKRYKEYRTMSNELCNGFNFFINNPIKLKWNDKGYFNIDDGHHRAMFLYSSGIRKIPAIISIREYNIWINSEKASKCNDMIKQQNRSELYTNITNPYFYSYPVSRDSCYKSRLDFVLEYLNSYRVNKEKILDVGSGLGYFSQHFSKEGADVTALEPYQDHYNLALLINDLTYTKYSLENLTLDDFNTNNDFDICILLTVLYHNMKNSEKAKIFINKINKLTKKLIIWESGDNPEIEKAFIVGNTKFHFYKKLANTYGTGKIRELGIFSTIPEIIEG